MDALHSILFYLFGAVAVAGAVGLAVLETRPMRGLAMAVAGAGLAGVDASLSAAASGAIVLVCYLGIAGLVLGTARSVPDPARAARQAAGPLAALAFAVLAYAAFRGNLHQSAFTGGGIGTAALGRFLVGREALGLIAVLAMTLLASMIGATTWRRGR